MAPFGDSSISFGELDRRASALAHSWRRQGAGPTTLAGLPEDRSVEMAADAWLFPAACEIRLETERWRHEPLTLRKRPVIGIGHRVPATAVTVGAASSARPSCPHGLRMSQSLNRSLFG
jgi:hypothetical protein